MLSEQTSESETQKRNSGHTGPTSTTGKAASARNATRHGMCATTLIMDGELEADWLELLQTWLEAYQNPAESTLLYTFVIKTAQAEWHRLRVQRQYDFHLDGPGNQPIGDWQPHEIKAHDLILRYLTAAERRFQREYRMLEHHWKSHQKNQKPAPAPVKQKTPEIRYTNTETAESVNGHGKHDPPNHPLPPSPGQRTRQATR
jgi:hypothetical protein